MRRIKILSDDLLHELMRRLMGLSVGANSFQYRGVTTPARPSVIWMLTCLLTKPGEPISVASMCKQMYGQPASLRAIRQTVFRVNRVFDRIGCSIVIRCHAAHILMQPKGIERVSITECQSEVETSHAIIQLS